MTITSRTRKLLWGNAANRCSFPACGAIEGASAGSPPNLIVQLEECHIVARESTGPRGNLNMTSGERDAYQNLILLCPIHHKMIDEQPDTYTVEALHSMKAAHERRVQQSLDSANMREASQDLQHVPDGQTRKALVDALDAEIYPRIREILQTIISFLSEVQPWTNAHANLLYDVGFTLWHIGEPGASIPRTARVQPMLDRIREGFVLGIKLKILGHVAGLNSSQAVDEFCWVLGALARQTTEQGFLSMVYDVVEVLSSGVERLLPKQGLLELGNSLGLARRNEPNDEMYQEWIDALVIHVGALFLDLGGEENYAVHLMGNGFAYRPKTRRPKHVQISELDGIKRESYDRALRLIGIKRFE